MEGSPMPLLFVYLMSRPGAKGLLDFSQLTKRPARAFGWLMLGNSIMMVHKMIYLHQMRGTSSAKEAFHRRVNQNE